MCGKEINLILSCLQGNKSFQDGVGEEKVCPDGLRFNEKASLFTYPCQYPIDVDCGSRTLLQVRTLKIHSLISII